MDNEDILSDIKTVLDISSRVDERVKIIQSGQAETHSRLNQLVYEINTLMTRVSVLESKNGGAVHKLEEDLHLLDKRVERIEPIALDFLKLAENMRETETRLFKIEDSHEGWAAKVKQYTGLVIQALWVIIVCYLLYKLGLNTPPIP